MILDAIILSFFWLFVFVFTICIGFALAPFKEYKGVLYNNLFTWFWYGLGISVAFLQIWNLFLPISIYTWLCLLPVAAFGGIRVFKFGLLRGITRAGNIALIAGIPVLIFLIVSSFDKSYIYDTLVYHFYTIKWFNNYPVTPGMGNLFIYLGLNQSYFLYPSFLNSLWDNYKGACSTNGLLTIVICSEVILSNAKYFFKGEKLTFSCIFQLLFLPLCINAGVQNLSSPTPDVFVNLFTFKVLSDVIHCLETKKVSFQDLFLLSFYCLFGVIMKLSFAGIALGVLVVVILLLFAEKLWKLNLIIRSIVLFLLLLVPWVLRGVISTGYIGFPLSLFGMPVDWQVPKSAVEPFAAFIKGFARSHLHGQGGIDAAYNYTWLPGWIKRMALTAGFILPILLFLGAGALLKIQRIKVSRFVLVLIPIFVSIIFWFFTAPDIRFAAFTFWTLGIAPLAYYIFQLKTKWINGFMIFIFICSVLTMARNWNTDPQPLGELPKQSNSVFTTKSGLKINTIKDTPPGDDWRVGDCTIPCAVTPDFNLVLRGTHIKDGFRINYRKP